jgi:hypothetical protein
VARSAAALSFGDRRERQAQHLYLIGGRNTVPGHPLHGYVGSRVVVADAEAWWPLPIPRWTHETDGVIAGAGLGIATLDGALRLDYVFPVAPDVRAGTFTLSVDPRFWPFL